MTFVLWYMPNASILAEFSSERDLLDFMNWTSYDDEENFVVEILNEKLDTERSLLYTEWADEITKGVFSAFLDP